MNRINNNNWVHIFVLPKKKKIKKFYPELRKIKIFKIIISNRNNKIS